MGHSVRKVSDTRLMRVHRCGLVVNSQQGFAIGDGSRVFHGARGEIREGDEVKLLERIFNRVIVVVELEDVFGGKQRVRPQVLLLGNGTSTNGNAVSASVDAREI